MSSYFGSQEVFEDARHKIIERAKVQLSENINVSIESQIVNKMTNLNSTSVSDFKKVSKSYSSLEVSGLHTDFYFNKKNKEMLAFAWVEKSKVESSYVQIISNSIKELLEINELSEKLMSTNKSEALENLYLTHVIFTKIDRAKAILALCGINDVSILRDDEVQNLRLDISNKIESIRNIKDLTLTALSSYLITSLKLQMEDLEGKIGLLNTTYRNSGFSSEFSEHLTSLLVNDLNKAGLEVVFQNDKFDSIDYMLSGTYWESGDSEIQVILYLVSRRGSNKGMIVGSCEGWTSKDQLLKSKLEYKPSNYFSAIEKEKLFHQKKMISDGAKLELWTDKGDEGLIYRTGEKLRLSVRMNKVGYIRLVNHLEDGSQVLLIDNYFISYRKVNRIIELPIELEVACPCGIEFIQANAQDIEFIPIETKNENGFLFIQNNANDLMITYEEYSELAKKNGGFAIQQRVAMATLD
ncbi:MAG: hypothetical protein ABJO02_04330 [Reichenbachiella sp.]|uniref:hypothetical protein n=1 Tax=Reichenbachiella sp. TaxID=2184521 RepID=UPI00329A1D20